MHYEIHHKVLETEMTHLPTPIHEHCLQMIIKSTDWYEGRKTTMTFHNSSSLSLSKHVTDDKILILIIDHARVSALVMARPNRYPLKVDFLYV